MTDFKRQFFDFVIQHGALQFGEFTLKSGRVSPYFYNARKLATGDTLKKVGQLYAQAIEASGVEFDVLFGPAYAGIPLVCTTAMGMAELGQDVPFCFNRKEQKTYGDKSVLLGSPLQGKVLVVDDVISAGTAFRESLTFIEAEGAKPAGLAIQFDRQERGLDERSAVQAVEQDLNVPVVSIVNLTDLIAYLTDKGGYDEHLAAIREYQKEYGV